MQTNKTVEVFCSYVHEDESWLRKLESHLSLLKRQGYIALWHDQLIIPGTDWTKSIDIHLETASVILLLVSADFLASDYCYGIEMTRALERHQRGEAQVIPILIRQVDWKHAPFAHLRVLPTNAKPLAMWEDKDAALADVAEHLRRIIEGEPLPDGHASQPAPSSVWNVPHRRNPHFTGRDELLDQLHQQLLAAGQHDTAKTRRAALTQPQAIKGLGGVGKTQIAVEYAYRSRDQGCYAHTLWVNAASEDTMITSFVTIAELLPSFPEKNETDQRKLVEAVKYWLEQCQQSWLMIFDNADDIALVQNYLPPGGNKGCILLTTRANAVGALAASIEVETMGFVEGTQLLLRRAQLFENASDEEFNLAGNIVVALDHFPLALDQAGAYIEETRCNFVDYLTIYQNHRQVLLGQRGIQVNEYPSSVATTWLLSFEKVQQANPAAAELLYLCAFLAPDRIPEELIRDGTTYWPSLLQQAAMDLSTFQQTIAELLKFSLVKRLVEDHALSIHRLVQAVQRDRLEPQMQRQWVGRVIRAVNKVFPDDPKDIATWPQCLRYLDQAQACHALIEHDMLLPATLPRMMVNTPGVPGAATFVTSRKRDNRLLNYVRRFLPPDFLSKVVAHRPSTSLSELFPLTEAADLFNRTGRYLKERAVYAQVEPLYLDALAIREQQLGANHPDTATSLSNLALLYNNQGRYAEAEPLHRRVLAIREQQLGANHPDTADSLNNLAGLYYQQGRYEEAEPLYQQALAIKKQQLGTNHPSIANNLNNLALLYNDQGRYEEAEPLYQQALTIREQQLGANHPDTANSLNNLALLYNNQKRYIEAEPLHQRALAIFERQLGTDHPNTTTCLKNLSIFYYKQGKYAQSESLLKRVLAINEQILGLEHPETQDVRQGYIILLQKLGRDRGIERLEEGS